MMNKLLLLPFVFLSACVVVMGCSSTGTPVEAMAISYAEIASDVVAEIEKTYPPAKTSFYVPNEAKDNLGQALVAGLRGKAYAIVDSTGDPDSTATLSYRIVQYHDHEVLIAIDIDGIGLSRLYTISGSPISAWSRRS